MYQEDNGFKAWRDKIVTPDRVLDRIKPGMSIFIGTGLAEPRTLLKALLYSNAPNLSDLELIQLVSMGGAVSIEEQYSRHFRLKTFFSGWLAHEAITEGRVDLIPSRFSEIPRLIEGGRIRIDVAFVQITPPDPEGFSSLGVAVDVARQAMEKASIVVGEISYHAPRTLGDTFVHMDDFDFLVESTMPPIYFPTWETDAVNDKLAVNIASLIHDGNCLSFAVGPIFESLAEKLVHKRDLGIHSPFFTDAMMKLVRNGAVTNRRKATFRDKCLASYALGTKELMGWLDGNPRIEFQGIDVVADPQKIALNDNFVLILPARKVDLTGEISLPTGKGDIGAGPSEAQEFFRGASFSKGGRIIFALTSRNLRKQSNIVPSISEYPDQFAVKESLDLVVTEYGVTSLKGRTIRERALALIDIAHPDDRAELVRKAKEAHLLFPDQIYLVESGKLYPENIANTKIFRDNIEIHFRAIRPSDVDEMRNFFYRMSDESVYSRYFAPIDSMPHSEMQEYVNVDYRHIMSIVGITGDPPDERIIAESRYIRWPDRPFADVAFAVDENYRNMGIGSHMYRMLMKIAKENGLEGFSATVLSGNTAMMSAFRKNAPYPINAVLSGEWYNLSMPFFAGKNPVPGSMTQSAYENVQPAKSEDLGKR